jgi:hypothetical protein
MTAVTTAPPKSGQNQRVDHPYRRDALRQLRQHGRAQPEADAGCGRGERLLRQRARGDYLRPEARHARPDDRDDQEHRLRRGAGRGRAAGGGDDVQQLRQHDHAHAQAAGRRARCEHQLRQRAHAPHLFAVDGRTERHQARGARRRLQDHRSCGRRAGAARRRAGRPQRRDRRQKAQGDRRRRAQHRHHDPEHGGDGRLARSTFRGGCGSSPR